MQTGHDLRRHGCNRFAICRIPGWREIPSRRPGTRLFLRISNAPASGGDSTTASGMHRSKIFYACLSGSAQWLCRTAGRTDAPRHPEISVRFVPSCFPSDASSCSETPVLFTKSRKKYPENDGSFTHHFHRAYLLGKEASVCSFLLSFQTKSHEIPAI